MSSVQFSCHWLEHISGLIKDCSTLLAPQHSEPWWLILVLTFVFVHFAKKPSNFLGTNPQSKVDPTASAPARARAIWVAPKTLAATVSPLCLAADIASLLFSPPCRVGGAHPDLWGGGVRPWQRRGGSRPWWSGSARMLRAQRQDGAGRRGSRLLACSEKAAM
jgi:hypothetical protein